MRCTVYVLVCLCACDVYLSVFARVCVCAGVCAILDIAVPRSRHLIEHCKSPVLDVGRHVAVRDGRGG